LQSFLGCIGRWLAERHDLSLCARICGRGRKPTKNRKLRLSGHETGGGGGSGQQQQEEPI
jgi:hypothetical protein